MLSQPLAEARGASRARSVPWTLLAYVTVGIAALAPRVLDLGGFVTVDEQSFWLKRVILFMDALQTGNFVGTALTEHPGVTTMWLGTIGSLLRRALETWGVIHSPPSYPVNLALLRLPVVIVHTAGLLAGYWMLRRLLSPAVALLGALLWALDPFVIAYSRVLHVDGLAGTFGMLSLLAACCYWHHTQQMRWLVFSAVAAGLSILSKSPGVLLMPTVGGIGLLALYRLPSDERRPAGLIKPLLIWGFLCLLTIVAFWPALWVNPVAAYRQIQQGVAVEGGEPHPQGNFFLGRQDDAPGLLFYPVTIALRLTPITLIGLLGVPFAWRRLSRLNRADLTALVWYVLLFTAALSIFPKKFNRYMVPVFPALDVLAAVGLVWAAELLGVALARLRRDGAALRRVVSASFLSAAALFAALNAAWWHPYSLAAFNQLLGGARAGERAFMIGWGEGFEQVAAWLNQQPDITGVLAVTPIFQPLQPYLKPGAQTYAPKNGETPDKAGYVVVYVRYIQNGAFPPFDQYWGKATPLHTVTIHGVPYAWIYQAVPDVTQAVPADFGATIQLRGIVSQTPAARGAPLSVRLLWEAHTAPTRDYMLFAHLMGPDGERYAQIDVPMAASGWEAGRYPITELPLAIPANAPVGDYRLLIGLYDPATGQRLPLQAPTKADPALDGPDALLLSTIEVK